MLTFVPKTTASEREMAMARPTRPAGVDPFADLQKKIEILEREMAVQRAAIERLKTIGHPSRQSADAPVPVRRTA